MTSEHVSTERERALCNRLSATAGTQRDRRGRERGRMNRDKSARGEVGGRAWEWEGDCSGGGAFISARGLHVKSSSSFRSLYLSSLSTSSPLGSFVLWFSMLNLYTVTVNVQYYFFFKFHMTGVVHRDSNYTDE